VLAGTDKLRFIQIGPETVDLATLASALTPAATVVDVAATGKYDSTANTFTANRIAVPINA
jgi:hypothetical protein